MPSTSAKQHRFMEAIKHSPAFAAKAGVPQSVGRDFAAADDKAGITKSHSYAGGGKVKTFPIPSNPGGPAPKPDEDPPYRPFPDEVESHAQGGMIRQAKYAGGGAVGNMNTKYAKGG